jgi:hypothetical protein
MNAYPCRRQLLSELSEVKLHLISLSIARRRQVLIEIKAGTRSWDNEISYDYESRTRYD